MKITAVQRLARWLLRSPALGGIETGDGIPAPPEKEWAARNDALARARIFRDARFDASTVDFANDPNGGVIDPTLTTCRYKPDEVSGTTPKFDCELPSGDKIKVKYGWTKEIPSEIVATRLLHASWVRRRSRVARPNGSLLRMPLSTVPHALARRDRRAYRLPRQAHQLHPSSRFPPRQRRAQSRRRSHRSRQRARVGIPGAETYRSLARRRHPRRSRRAAIDGGVPPPLGQQDREPAFDLR